MELEDVRALAGQLQEPVRVGFAHDEDEGTVANDIRERAFLPPGWSSYEQKVPAPEALKFRTLTALVDYIGSIEGIGSEVLGRARGSEPGLYVTVSDFDQVDVRRALEGPETDFRRAKLAVTSPHLPALRLGAWLTLEDAVTHLCTAFEKSPERDELVRLFANVTENDVRTTGDSGIAQSVAVQSGLKLAMEQVPNPVLLRPFRTFHEVDQPASLFYLRMRKGERQPEVIFNEADGGAWKRTAVLSVGDWLRKGLEGKGVPVMA